MFQFITFVTQL